MQKFPARSTALFAVTGLVVGYFTGADPAFPIDKTVAAFSEAAQSQIAQTGFFFTIAAWLHSGRVKKEIKTNFSELTTAINGVASAFREDLKKHGERLDNLASRVTDLETRTKG